MAARDTNHGTGALTVGARLLYDGGVYKVVGLEGGTVRLQGARGGASLLAVRELVEAPDFEILDEESGEDEELGSAEFDSLPEQARKKAEERRNHVNELATGYRSGDPGTAAAHEPRPEYDVAITTLNERLDNKTRETGIGKSSLWRFKSEYEKSGLLGLVDKRHVRRKTAFDKLDPRIREAINSIFEDITDESTPTYQRVLRLVKTRLDRDYGKSAVEMPSRATLYRMLEELDHGRRTFGSAKARRSVSNLPQTTYKRFKASRPGEVVRWVWV